MLRLGSFLLICSLLMSGSAIAQSTPYPIAHCQQEIQLGFPQSQKPNSVVICRLGYALLHDNSAKIAAWVAYVLTPSETIGCVPRSNSFAADSSLKKEYRAEPSDYANSGYDMGHLANNADMSWDLRAAKESFILSNIAPQLPNLNRGLWKQLEFIVRAWALDRPQGLTIYTGSIYNVDSDKKIGANKVVVPNSFYKIVVDNAAKTSLAFIFPHKSSIGTSVQSMQVSVSEIERRTDIKFPVPDNKEIMSKFWSYDLRKLTVIKKNACNS